MVQLKETVIYALTYLDIVKTLSDLSHSSSHSLRAAMYVMLD